MPHTVNPDTRAAALDGGTSLGSGDLSKLRLGNTNWYFFGKASPELLQTMERAETILPAVSSGPRPGEGATSIAVTAHHFLKRFNHQRNSLGKRLKLLFRAAPAVHAFRMGRQIAGNFIPTPLPLAYGIERSAVGFLKKAYLITEILPEITTLAASHVPTPQKAREAAGVVSSMHLSGFLHRDLNLNNLVYDATGRLHIVDLDTTRFVGFVEPNAAIEELARFLRNATRRGPINRSTRAQFLREYCRRREIDDWKSWWKQIESRDSFERERLARKNRKSR